MSGRIMECEDCEKWYWAGQRVEVPALFKHCETTILHPHLCYEEVRETVLAAGAGFPRRRLAEFNHLCAECPNGRFLPGRDSHQPRHNSPTDAP